MIGTCECVNCGYKMKIPVGSDCSSIPCPNCGSFMIEKKTKGLNRL